MLNVHATGGRDMLEAAKNALDPMENAPKLIAVTVLTSMAENDLLDIGVQRKVSEQALGLAELARAAGLDGVVCSAQEASLLRQKVGDKFVLVTPGIRLREGVSHDQKRVMTPIEAVKSGSDYLVIGRPITQAADPMAVVRSTNSQIIESM
jgi:orotidine-5'-phosphate decarboxylase